MLARQLPMEGKPTGSARSSMRQSLIARAIKATAAELQKQLSDVNVGLIHGQAIQRRKRCCHG